MIGRRWKSGNGWSLTALIGRGLDSKLRRTKKDWKTLESTCAVVRMRKKKDTISGGNSEGVPPVPIPNTEVKPFSAESTWLVTARKHRSPPDPIAGHVSVLLFDKENPTLGVGFGEA